jgi:dihydroxyacid dehydratase/phosphogluconate dehydratase
MPITTLLVDIPTISVTGGTMLVGKIQGKQVIGRGQFAGAEKIRRL